MSKWTRLACVAMAVCLAATVAQAEVIGPPLIDRPGCDTGTNYLFLHDDGTATPGFTRPGVVTDWSFYNDNGTTSGGRTIEPVFRPLGYDWQLSVGILSSFAAREVFVSSMAIICGAGGEADDAGIIERIKTADRDDGTPLLTLSTASGLLVFYVLAMQCLPTLAVTRREAGGWRWAGLQLGAMSLLAWIAAFAVRQGLLLFGVT